MKTSEKSTKMVNVVRENLHVFWTTWGISMNLFLKHMTNDNIESHKEIGPHTLSKRYIFGKPQEGGGGGGLKWTFSLFRVNESD